MPIKNMTLEEFLEFLKKQQGDRTDKQFADSLGVSPQYLCDVYNNRRVPGKGIASAVNATRSLVYTVIPTERKEEKK